MSITLFRPATQFEATKRYAYGGGRGAAADAGGLGDFWTDLVAAPGNLLKQAGSTVVDVVDTVTGAKASRESRTQALELAKLQADAQIAASQARSATFQSVAQSVAPWVAVGVGLVVVAMIWRK